MTDDTKATIGTKTKIPTKGLSPEGLAHLIYDEAIVDAKGDEIDASIMVMRFLTDALIYSVGMSCGGDEDHLKGTLERLGKLIAEAPTHPIVAAAAEAKKQP